ncbi:ferrous iron transport protein B [Thermoanaerobacterium sp. DL9XJH110]|uniref:ferrous iron transport protein B n=1 Tax=Thermoanaerobacterium sp. DL9XJH110 TaxID=3386643 RepID=UPI003BB75A47
MGLTGQSTWVGTLKENFRPDTTAGDSLVVALAGNPNTGKSTVFNSLTGLNQHTGNWPGKTVANARGVFSYKNKKFVLVDLPGTYSLMAGSVEEEVARDFICSGKAVVTVVVADATCLERNLILALQVLEITSRVVLCVNLMDEARRKNIRVDLKKLSELLGVPVVGTSARDGEGLDELKEAIHAVAVGEIKCCPPVIIYDEIIESNVRLVETHIAKIAGLTVNARWAALRFIEGDLARLESSGMYPGCAPQQNHELTVLLDQVKKSLHEHNVDSEHLRDVLVSRIVKLAEEIAGSAVVAGHSSYSRLDRKIDDVLTSKILGFPIMAALLGMVLWITIVGANYPSDLLAAGFFWFEGRLTDFFLWAGLPGWLHGLLVLGMYRTLAWVVSVMLPPMAIFFPLFTLLEDLGYLPRVAFNLDNFFKKACAHGKQALTMCMGFGCNAAGVTACRIIESPRERFIAVITNNFVPCNGRFPTLITLSAIFFAGSTGAFQSLSAAVTLLGAVVSSVIATLGASFILSKTLLKGVPSSFSLELPPYRRPQVVRILVRSLLDRTMFVLARAATVAAPAGAIIWLMANTSVGGLSILDRCARFLQPFAYLLGMDGYILTAFILGFPANEIVIPITVMSYLSAGSMLELNSLSALKDVMTANGWTRLTALCTMLFSLNHFPCGTTMLTILKETQSRKWSFIAFFMPTLTGIIICFVVAQTARLLGLV